MAKDLHPFTQIRAKAIDNQESTALHHILKDINITHKYNDTALQMIL